MDNDDISSLRDRQDIAALLDEYCLRLELNDFEEWLDLFADDCTYDIFRRTLRGRDEVRDMLSQAPAGIHLGGPSRIEVTGDTAETVQSYLFINSATRDQNMGWYYRTLVRTNGGWKIQHMSLKMAK